MSGRSNALALRGEHGVVPRLARWLIDWEPSGERTPLLRSDQLGILPTMGFWLRNDLRHILLPSYLAGLASAVVLASVIGASPLLGGLLGAALPLLGIGVLERFVRRAARRRRTAALRVLPSR